MAISSKNALLGIGRLNAFRLNYLDAALQRQRDTTYRITLNGVPLRVRLGSITIKDVINDAPNTCTLVVDDATPPIVGQRLKITLGVDPARVLFVGTLQAARQTYVGRAHADAWNCEAIDDTNRADWLRPFGSWENVSATTVAQQLVSSFCPGFTSTYVQAGLPIVTINLDGTERINGALRLLAKLIGGYFYFEDYALHLFQGDEPGENPDDIDGRTGQLLDEPRITVASDDSQIRTRCFGKGHAEPTIAAVNAGETIIPIANAVTFNPAGGKAIIEPQRINYTGTAIGGTGALVGPGVTPSAPPVVAPAPGAGIEAGAHSYAISWVTAAGETLPSPAAAVALVGAVAAPTIYGITYHAPPETLAGPPVGLAMRYALTIQDYYSAAPSYNETPLGAPVAATGNGLYISVSFLVTAVMKDTRVNVWRSDNGGAWGIVNWYPVTTQPVGGLVVSGDQTTGGVTPTTPPAGNLGQARANISGIAVGPAAVTARKIYRTTANTATPLKLLTTIANNTATTYADAAADATLGAAPPGADTSGLQQPAGQVNAGAATIPVSSTAWALAAGGWAIVGNGEQVIRYTGISGNTITGIPATGNGSIGAPVNYNSTLTGAPILIGVSGLGLPVRAGAPVAIWVQADDTAAQAALAARVGGSGVIEHLIADERRGELSLLALCQADLVQYSRPLVTARYTCFDPKTRSGRPVRVHLTQPAIDQSLVIQDVTITHEGSPRTFPRFAVTASTARFALEDLLRRMVGTLEEGF